jgi:hypothetical protein
MLNGRNVDISFFIVGVDSEYRNYVRPYPYLGDPLD